MLEHNIKLHSLSLLCCAGFPKVVELNVEPLVDLTVDGMVLGADLLGSKPLLQGFCLSGRSILVCATNIKDVVVAKPAVPEVDRKKEFIHNS